MFNDLSSPLSYLSSRRSGRAREMVGPGPDADELAAILAMAARTPDHGKLAPWRFVVVGSDQRDELAALLARALAENDPDAGEAHRVKADEFARSGEALVVLLSTPVIPHKIPVWEQELSVGAAAMNLLHAIHAHGYVGSWLTGWAAYDPLVRDAFCLGSGERIAGFFFIGSPGRPLEERPRPDMTGVVRHWSPPL
nr:nitroreductase [uncultured Sphingomonas sp.]